jgi:hypothetical protein
MVGLIYIMGARHCGSTILDIALGQSDSIVSLGQANFLGRFSMEDNIECSCGKLLSECEFWQPVIKDMGDQEIARLALAEAWYDRERHILGTFAGLKAANTRGRTALSAVERIADSDAVSGKLLVDSSKNVSRGLALTRAIGRDDSIIVHLSRRSGDYITSALKRDREYSVPERPFRHLIYWLAKNSLVAGATRLGRTRYVRIRWEAMNEVPPELEQFLAEHKVDDVDTINSALSGGAQMSDYHIFSGNKLIRARSSAIEPQRKAHSSVEEYWWSFILPLADRLFGYK